MSVERDLTKLMKGFELVTVVGMLDKTCDLDGEHKGEDERLVLSSEGNATPSGLGAWPKSEEGDVANGTSLNPWDSKGFTVGRTVGDAATKSEVAGTKEFCSP
uniref:Uncharacterized protein n=1 Tax=Micrurus surinamensis TaxID=129470 RepID=A0A2D4PUA9_MICSU